MNNLPLVSICTTTHNRVKYIGQAIESCMTQKTNFPFEMIICDNCSDDGTLEEIKRYQSIYPERIKLYTSEKNYGLMVNFIKSIELATGRYIADCDGDDYWIDDQKLQKQVDFLEENPEYIMCFTNTLQINSQTNESWVAKKYIWDTCDTEGLLFQNSLEMPKFGEDICCPGHISSIVFRNNILSFPDWYKDCYVNDETLFLMLSKYGKAKFINEVCSAYRMTPIGYSTFNFSIERDIRGRIFYYHKMNLFFEFKYNKPISGYIARYYFKLVKYYYKSHEYRKAFISLFYTFRNNTKVTIKLLSKKIVD